MNKVSSQEVVFSLLIRLLHWGLAVTVTLNLFFTEEGEDLHEWLGYLAALFVGLRVLRGFLIKDAGGFDKISFRPSIYIHFFKSLLNSQARRLHANENTHNPLAWIVYLGIWMAVLALAVTGWMMGLDRYWGEEWLENLHHQISNGLLVLVIFHLLGIAVDAILFRRASWMVMLHGKRSRK